LRRRTLITVQRFRQDPRHGCLADASRAGKQIGMRHTVQLNGILERPRDVPLLDDIIKGLRAPFAGRHLIRHDPVLLGL
jgi:hypothetical protein